MKTIKGDDYNIRNVYQMTFDNVIKDMRIFPKVCLITMNDTENFLDPCFFSIEV